MRANWPAVATGLGYESEALMWKELYGRFSLSQLSLRFGVSVAAVRFELRRCGFRVQRRGGDVAASKRPRSPLTSKEARALQKEGVGVAAKRLGVPYHTLYARVLAALKRAAKKRKQV
jgi:hypothetical protein